ncbi:TIGR02588 family protein [Blastococcus goldschmidtiae]|uniref:TIGR02588 family protein n=1 Tax=Blastococcus goldschmidtiae TaxID=3075546 RepID=A0ABU2K7J6_9ACTN|nr:TIGR02588 family protein [Blastococcus sp. DSM 46792]MDT0276138.1 TIGR02588 family protein [Blastococcus sp. DSM 46792]
MSSSDDEEQGEQQKKGGTTPGEYVVGAVGGLVVLALLAFLAYQTLAVRETGPELAVSVTAIEPALAGYAVHFEVVNNGGRTAEQVQLSGTLTREGRQVEQSTAAVAYLPPESRRDGVLVFSEDPREGDLTVGPSGYVLP